MRRPRALGPAPQPARPVGAPTLRRRRAALLLALAIAIAPTTLHAEEGEAPHPAEHSPPTSALPLAPNPVPPAEMPTTAPAAPLDGAGEQPAVTPRASGEAPSAEQDPLSRVMPRVQARGARTAIGLLFTAGVLALAAAALRRIGARLRPTGLLPSSLRVLEVLARLLVVFFGLGGVGAIVPASIAPAMPIVVIAAAVALGWSARDVLQDLVAGLFIAVEGQLRAGYWVSGERYAGTVEALGLRVTWLRDVHGRRIVVPNRVLLGQPLVTDDKPWPRIQFQVALPLPQSTTRVRAALQEAILLSPWVAPEPALEVHPDALDATTWHVAVRVLDAQYAHRFQGLLRERVEEILAG